MSWFTRCCIATDIPDNFDLDVNTVYASLRGINKAHSHIFHPGRIWKAPIVEMLDFVEVGDGAFSKRPYLESPYQPDYLSHAFCEDAVDVTFECPP